MTSRTILHAAILAAALAAGVIALRGLERSMGAVFDKPPAPLQRPLEALARRIGGPAPLPLFEAPDPDGLLDAATVESLGTRDYLLRLYDRRPSPPSPPSPPLAPGQAPVSLQLNLNYYAAGSGTPHVPEVCWAGAGLTEAPGSREIFEVPGVVRRDGSTITLRVRLISFLPPPPSPISPSISPPIFGETGPDARPGDAGEARFIHVAYLFQVNGDYVATAQEVTSRFWKAGNRYAWHAKIEMTPAARSPASPPAFPPSPLRTAPIPCTRGEAKQLVGDFLRASLARIESCLPDPALLAGEATARPPSPSLSANGGSHAPAAQ